MEVTNLLKAGADVLVAPVTLTSADLGLRVSFPCMRAGQGRGSKTGAKGAGHILQKNDIAIGHDRNWLEPTRSKMAEDLTSSRHWASSYAHCDTFACEMTHLPSP